MSMEDGMVKQFGVDNIKSKKESLTKGGGTIIFAAHPDDEIIGCYEVLIKEKPLIIYSGDTEPKRREEALKLRGVVDIGPQLFLMSIPQNMMNKTNKFYFPDPVYERHPQHRLFGMMGEQLARIGMDVIFYNTNMNAPYIHECPDSKAKEELLNKVYPSQKNLWEWEKKYILFEGYNKWIF